MASASFIPSSTSSAMSPNTSLPTASSAAAASAPVDAEAVVASTSNMGTSSIEDALAWMRQGGFVVVMDNEDRENEGDLIATAESATEESVAFMLRHTTGIVCVPALAERLHTDLQLPLMVENNTEVHKCKFTITVDLREGNSTGVSAADRARTIRALADPTKPPAAFNRPGHIFPLVAQDGGVLVRAGHTEAAVDLARLAGSRPVGYICEMNDDRGRMMRRPQLQEFAKVHALPLITISDLIRYRVRTETLVERMRVPHTKVVTPLGTFAATTYKSLIHENDQRYEVLVYGDITATPDEVAVYFVEEGLAASVQAQWAQQQIVKNYAAGIVIYVQDASKLLAISGALMARQSMFGMGLQIVRDLGVESVVLLTSAPDATLAFDPHGFGVAISRVEAVATGL